MNIKNILVVDDDPVDRRLVKMLLAKSGPLGRFKVETAGTLSKAIEYLNSGSYDLVLLDLNLPDSRGIDTVQKAHDANSDIPIVVLTGLDDEEMGLEAIRKGAEDYLVKGKSLEYMLVRTIRYSLERKGVKQQLLESEIAKRQAQAANRAKSEFLANMSHELRTLLHSILGFASFGIKKYDSAKPEKLLDYFNRIKQSGKTLLELLNDLLDSARLESRKLKFVFEPVNLAMLVSSVTNELDTMLLERNLAVQHEVSDFNEQITLDAEKIKQVLRNLLNNAIKFSPRGGTIDVAIYRVDSSVRVSVRDQGFGIPQEELEVVFDKFVQSSKTRTGSGGTGLGLAICREILTAHKGRIWAENRPEGGAVFSFEIPLSLDAHTQEQPLLVGADNHPGL